MNWKKLSTKEIESPFIPLMKKTDFDQDEQITIENEEEAELIEKNSLLLRKTEFQELFKQYLFNYQANTTIVNGHKSREVSEKIIKEKSGKITPKAPNTSSKTIKNRKLDNTIRNSK